MLEPTVESVMTSKVITARRTMSFKELVALMAEHRVSGIPVVDFAGRPVGVVSEADTLAKQEFHGGTGTVPWLAGRKRRARWRKSTGLTAAELMTSPAITVEATEPVTAAARKLAERRVRRLCVVDGNGVLAGVVSRRDVLGMFLRQDQDVRDAIEQQVLRRGMWLIPGTVTVRVAAGVATLDGSVERRSTAEVAERLTHAVPGVVGVVSNLSYEVDDTISTGL